MYPTWPTANTAEHPQKAMLIDLSLNHSRKRRRLLQTPNPSFNVSGVMERVGPSRQFVVTISNTCTARSCSRRDETEDGREVAVDIVAMCMCLLIAVARLCSSSTGRCCDYVSSISHIWRWMQSLALTLYIARCCRMNFAWMRPRSYVASGLYSSWLAKVRTVKVI